MVKYLCKMINPAKWLKLSIRLRVKQIIFLGVLAESYSIPVDQTSQ